MSRRQNHLDRNRHRVLATGASGAFLSLIVAASPSFGEATGDSSLSGLGYQEFTLDASDYAFDWPATIEAGPTVVTMENNGQDVHHAQLVRLNDGATLGDVETAMSSLEEDPGALFSQVTMEGGPGIITPGASQRLVLDLEPGSYVWICGIPAADGVPHFAKGMIQQFDIVSADGVAAGEPNADQTLVMADFAYGIPESFAAGGQLWKVVNEGAQPHEMLLAKLEPGATAMDFAMAAFDPSASGPPPGLPVGGLQAIAPGDAAWLELELDRGTYAAICYVPDPESGQPHLALGMITEFTVEPDTA